MKSSKFEDSCVEYKWTLGFGGVEI